MKKNETSTTAISFILFVVCLTTGCKKKNTEEGMSLTDNPTSLIQSAKNYFVNLVNKEKDLSLQPHASKLSKNSSFQNSNRLTQIRPLVLWDSATKYNLNGVDYVFIPLRENIKPFGNKRFEFFREIIFSQSKSQKAEMHIVEVLSKQDESLGNNNQRIAITAFTNKYLSQEQALDTLNASIIFYNENYVRETSFQIKKGKWLPARISFRSDLDIKQ